MLTEIIFAKKNIIMFRITRSMEEIKEYNKRITDDRFVVSEVQLIPFSISEIKTITNLKADGYKSYIVSNNKSALIDIDIDEIREAIQKAAE